MATLAELLISKGINPEVFADDVKFIVQDKTSNKVYTYFAEPILSELYDLYRQKGMIECIKHLVMLASDWKTPLSIEDYTAAWNAAHNVNVKEEENVMCEDVKSEWPKVMQQISGNRTSLVVVSFESEFVGTCLINEDHPSYVTGLVESDWWSCFSTTTWKPYIIPEIVEEWPKIMQSLDNGQVVEFTSLNSGTVIIKGKFSYSNCVGFHCDEWVRCTCEITWKPYVEATQTISAAFTDVPATMAAQDIVKRLEELKMGIDSTSKDIGLMQVELSHQKLEYAELRDTLLTLI